MDSFKPSSVKEHNLNLLRQLFVKGGGFSARELAEKTGLSVVSINKLLVDLKAAEEIQIAPQPQTTGGRRATMYQYNPNRQLLLVLQFVEEKTAIVANLVVVNLFGELLQQRKLTSEELVYEQLQTVIQETIVAYPQIQLLVLGITGAEIDGRLQIMDFAPLHNLNLRELLSEAFSREVLIENDINAAALSQALSNQPKGITVALYYPENFPPGAGIVIQGRIFHGTHGLSGEIKHLPFVMRENFPVSLATLQQQIEEMLQTVISAYDPSQIILYVNNSAFKQTQLDDILKKLTIIFPYFKLPPISLTATFQTDYLNGLLQLGLKKLREFMS